MMLALSNRRRVRWLATLGLVIFGMFSIGPGQTAWAQTAATCNPAQGNGVGNGNAVDDPPDYGAYCWIDFSSYSNTQATSGGQAFVVTLPGGATLTFTLTLSAINAAGNPLVAASSPTYVQAAFGNSAFINIPGQPVLYQFNGNGPQSLVTLSSLHLAANGSPDLPFVFVAADGESTNTGETLSFTTAGAAWQLAASPGTTSGRAMPTLSGSGTATVTETGNSTNDTGSYVFTTDNSPGTVSATLNGSGKQGVIFGLKFNSIDLALTQTYSGDKFPGGTGNFTISTTNTVSPIQHPPTSAQPIRITDTLPAGLTYTGYTGSSWSCAASGQVVTCNLNSAILLNTSKTLPSLAINVQIANGATGTLTNPAVIKDVTTGYVFDTNQSNNTGTAQVTIVHPDLSTSTKTVSDVNGGDANPGDTLRYTITLNESAGVAASNASVTDDMPAGVTGFTIISTPTGSTNASISSGGSNGTGKVNVTGINMPASGSVSIVYEVTIAATDGPGYTIDNIATIANPNGPGAAPAAPTVTVSQSQVAAAGNKVLYLYDDQSMTRIAQTSDSTTPVNINGSGATQSWQMTPGVATGKTLVLSAGAVSIPLVIEGTNKSSSNNRPVNVELLTSTGASLGNATQTVNNNNPTLYTYTLSNIPQTTLTAGQYLVLRITNKGSPSNRQISVYQKSGALYSRISFYTTTVINVDSVNFYSAAYPATTTQTTYGPGDIVYVRAVISDPFGSYDVNHATVTGTDPTGNVVATNAPMTQVADSGAATRTFEVAYTIPPAAPTGYWTASVTGYEGTEGTVQHTAKAAFNVGVPNLLVIKSVTVISDPVEGTTKPKSLPGAVMQYQITVSNNGSGPADNNSLVITDPLPATTKFLLGSVVFTDGTPNSGLSLAPANVSYSNVGSAGPWTYTPVSDGSGADPNVKALKIAPQGTLAGKSGATAPNFSVTFRIIIL